MTVLQRTHFYETEYNWESPSANPYVIYGRRARV